MKKYAALIAALIICFSFNCKKNEERDSKSDGVLAKKYAKYRLAVKKEPELKNWLATLEKGEDVDLLKEESVAQKKGAPLNISRIKLAGGEEGFVESRHLADRTIVFTEDTPAFIRPTMGSRLHVKMPRGSIAFVVGEQANWVKIFAGKVQNTYVSDQWVQGGYTSDPQLLLTARIYESAIDLLASGKKADRENGLKKLAELGEGTTIFAEMARAKIAEGEKADQGTEEQGEAPKTDGDGQEKAPQPGQG
jgi:lipoprotein LenA